MHSNLVLTIAYFVSPFIKCCYNFHIFKRERWKYGSVIGQSGKSWENWETSFGNGEIFVMLEDSQASPSRPSLNGGGHEILNIWSKWYISAAMEGKFRSRRLCLLQFQLASPKCVLKRCCCCHCSERTPDAGLVSRLKPNEWELFSCLIQRALLSESSSLLVQVRDSIPIVHCYLWRTLERASNMATGCPKGTWRKCKHLKIF
jgi:hypothetical protein